VQWFVAVCHPKMRAIEIDDPSHAPGRLVGHVVADQGYETVDWPPRELP
jgi:hypothetical protein